MRQFSVALFISENVDILIFWLKVKRQVKYDVYVIILLFSISNVKRILKSTPLLAGIGRFVLHVALLH